MPTNETTRRTRSMAADDGRLSAAETNAKTPNTPTAHAPIDIGSQNLKTRIMFMKRAGTPRSAMRSAPQTATSGRAMKYPIRATFLSPGSPKRSAMAAVKYAPPAMPPRKKYQTISISQPGALSIATSLAARAEREHRTEADDERRPDRQERVDDDVALRKLRARRQVVRLRLREQEEERVEATQESLGVGAVQLRVLEAEALQRLHPLLGLRDEIIAEAELDRLRRARFGARRSEAVVNAVVTERALLGGARLLVERDDAERTRRHAVPAAVAHVLIDVDGAELRALNRARRTRVETPGVRAVLADVGHQEPRHVAGGPRLLDESHEAERLIGEVGVVLVAARPLGHFHLELVPLLARHLARATADAQGRIGEHRQGAGHYATPFFTL